MKCSAFYIVIRFLGMYRNSTKNVSLVHMSLTVLNKDAIISCKPVVNQPDIPDGNSKQHPWTFIKFPKLFMYMLVVPITLFKVSPALKHKMPMLWTDIVLLSTSSFGTHRSGVFSSVADIA